MHISTKQTDLGSSRQVLEEETIRLVETTGAAEVESVAGTCTGDEDTTEVCLPIRVSETVFETKSHEGELRIEVVDVEGLVS